MIIKILDNLYLESTNISYAPTLFSLINKNREYLREWLPKTDLITDLTIYENIVSDIEKRFNDSRTGAFVIIKDNNVIGTLDLQLVDKDNNIGGLGYWIDEDYQKQGIITISLKKLIDYAFDLNLHKLIIQCIVENTASANVALRLGFKNEAIFEKEFLLHRKYHDLARYCLFNDKM